MFSFIKHTFLEPLQEFIHDSRAIGIMLLLCTAASLIIANIPFTSANYTALWQHGFNGTQEHHTHIGFLSLPNSLLVFINDGLMALFFFIAGMEIKRELLEGELSSFKKATLPVMSAVGGMLVPALLFYLFNSGTENMQGWAIPTATDIAFTLGVASLLGNKVPVGLKIFLTALAIIDDLGAIIVIAIFYGGDIHLFYLATCAVIVALVLLLNKCKVKFGILHIILGIALWYCMFNSGIHATVAGVIFAFLIPAKLLNRFELKLHAPVYFIIIPLFALANTAIVFPANIGDAINNHLSWGIIAGLSIGKPLGICLFAFALVKFKLADMPALTTPYQLIGGGILAGIGFTMSIFISTLAFSAPALQDIAKISVLAASFISMIVGYFWLRSKGKKV